MPTWHDIVGEIDAATDDAARRDILLGELGRGLLRIGEMRAGADGAPRNVVLYGSAWLQKPGTPGYILSVTDEDLNGLMAVIHGMDWARGLTLILHTPGGSPTSAQTVVEYLRSKFDDVEVIVPTYAMSAGTMIALGTDRIIMGRHSQLGPIDPQIAIPGSPVMSARGIVDLFEQAQDDIVDGGATSPAAAALWAPILASMGPALLSDARRALAFGEDLVANWLATYMLRHTRSPQMQAAAIARHFNDATNHKSHGRRIDRSEARLVGLTIEDLETSQDLQEEVLSVYHRMTIAFERTALAKMIVPGSDDSAGSWLKNVASAPI